MSPLRVVVAASALLAANISASAAAAQDRPQPKASVRGVDEARLRDSLTAVIGEVRNPPQSRFEARRWASEAAEDAVALLRSEGYYQAIVEPDVAEGDQPQALLRVETGRRFQIGSPGVQWDAPEPIPAARLAGQASIGLTLGGPGRAADILGAEGRILAALQARGYADAAALPREVIVDHADFSVRPTFRIAAGDRVRMDGVRLNTEGRTSTDWVLYLAPWGEGDVYDPEDVAELERRLLDTGVFDSVTVSLAPESDSEGLRPVVVNLADRPAASLELGASYSTAEGAGVDGRWIRYNRLNRADTLTLIGRLADIQSRAEVELALPHWRRPQQTLKLGAAVYSDDTDAYRESGARVRADLQRRFRRTDHLTFGVTLDAAQADERRLRRGLLVKERRSIVSLTGLVALAVDRSSDPLDPRDGWRFEARLEPTVNGGDSQLVYGRVQVQGSYYLGFGEQKGTVVAARLKLGSIVGGTMWDVPASRRFYAGGGGSVRGYEYQAVGLRFPDNTPQGGLSVVETSLELRQKLFGPWSVAGFVDAGALGEAQTFNLKDPSSSAGFGVRYDLGFGPIRADIAFPLEKRRGDPSFQVYLSIGQSF